MKRIYFIAFVVSLIISFILSLVRLDIVGLIQFLSESRFFLAGVMGPKLYDFIAICLVISLCICIRRFGWIFYLLYLGVVVAIHFFLFFAFEKPPIPFILEFVFYLFSIVLIILKKYKEIWLKKRVITN